MWLDNPVNLDDFCNESGYALDELMLYWGINGKFIPYRPSDGDYITVFGESYHVSEFEVIHVDNDCITIVFVD